MAGQIQRPNVLDKFINQDQMKTLRCVDRDFDSLTAEESKRIGGGGWLSPTLALISAIIYIYNNQDDITEGFEEGFMSTYEGD